MAENRPCLIQRLANKGLSQCSGYDFQSMANIGGRLFGANEDGIYEIGTADDFAGVDIAAWLCANYDFQQLVKIRSMWFGFESGGNLSVTVTFDEKTAQARTEVLTPKATNQTSHGSKMFFGRDDEGQYLEIKVSNVDGADFSVNSIQGVFVPLGRRR